MGASMIVIGRRLDGTPRGEQEDACRLSGSESVENDRSMQGWVDASGSGLERSIFGICIPCSRDPSTC